MTFPAAMSGYPNSYTLDSHDSENKPSHVVRAVVFQTSPPIHKKTFQYLLSLGYLSKGRLLHWEGCITRQGPPAESSVTPKHQLRYRLGSVDQFRRYFLQIPTYQQRTLFLMNQLASAVISGAVNIRRGRCMIG